MKKINPKILLLGGSGLLGSEFSKYLINQPFDVLAPSSDYLNAEDMHHFKQFLKYSHFDIIINCIGFTDLKKAELDNYSSLLQLLNVDVPLVLSQACERKEALLIHFSTDYVFDGIRRTPYTEKCFPNPINQYGKSKLQGENVINSTWNKHFIIRTGSLYSMLGHGKLNFVDWVRSLDKSWRRDPIIINNFKKMTPTSAKMVVANTMYMVNRTEEYGIYHMTAGGECTWFDFAKVIAERFNIKREILGREGYEDSVPRPDYSVLKNQRLMDQYLNLMMQWKPQFEEDYKDVI